MSDFIPKSNVAELHLTYRCDLGCTNCNRLCYLPPQTADMTVEDCQRFIQQCRGLRWTPRVFLMGGEPTLHPDLLAIVDLFHAAGFPTTVTSNQFSPESKELVARIRQGCKASIGEYGAKRFGKIIQSEWGYLAAPVDFGIGVRAPCAIHSSRSGICGISVDHDGYTTCCIGGAIDGFLKLGLRTQSLADLFDEEKAALQTRKLCMYCGHGMILGTGAGDGHDLTQMPRQVFAGLSVTFAPWIGALILFCWVVTEGKKFSNRKLLDRQSGLDSINELSWQEFEQLVGEAYRRQGYAVEHTGSDSGDGGIDLLLRCEGKTTLVQCKHWKAWRVGVKEVRELRGVVASEQAHHGIVVTYGSFTEDAIAFANRNPITLMAGPELERMIRSVQVTDGKATGRDGGGKQRATTGQEDREPTKPLPVPSAPSAAPTCPQCGSRMVERTAKRGQYSAQAFWGCCRYPECRGKRQI